MAAKNIELAGRLVRGSNVTQIVEQNRQIIEAVHDKKPKFPDIRKLVGADLITSFSHMNPNLPLDEIIGNVVLNEMAVNLGLRRERVFNNTYDMSLPADDRPSGYSLEIGNFRPKIILPMTPYFLQKGTRQKQVRMTHAESAVAKMLGSSDGIGDGANRLLGILDQFFSRLEAGEGIGSIPGLRQGFFDLLGVEHIPEVMTSSQLCKVADVLEALEAHGMPFWESPIPEGISKQRYLRAPKIGTERGNGFSYEQVSFNGGFFHIDGAEPQGGIHKSRIYDAIRNAEVVPTTAVLVLALTVVPEIPHMGGIFWSQYSEELLNVQGRWLGIKNPTELSLTTNPDKRFGSVELRQSELERGFINTYISLLRSGGG